MFCYFVIACICFASHLANASVFHILYSRLAVNKLCVSALVVGVACSDAKISLTFHMGDL